MIGSVKLVQSLEVCQKIRKIEKEKYVFGLFLHF